MLARLTNELMEDEKYHNLMRWLKWEPMLVAFGHIFFNKRVEAFINEGHLLEERGEEMMHHLFIII